MKIKLLFILMLVVPFICLGQNDKMSISLNSSKIISSQLEPEILSINPEKTECKEGCNVFIEVKYKSSLDVYGTLLFNGKYISSSRIKTTYKDGSVFIYITNVKDSDSGVYTIRLVNRLGSAQKNFILEVTKNTDLSFSKYLKNVYDFFRNKN